MPARLHHERIVRSDQTPTRWLAMTHGIYGAGSNWRSIARKITERRPEWGVVLVDLRQHGKSEGGEPPHTVAACADDLRALIESLGEAGGEIQALAGHSFGGKCALATRPLLGLRQIWVLDASPSAGSRSSSARPGGQAAGTDSTVLRVLAFMERAPRVWARRDDFVAAVVADGHDAGLAQWLAMSLVPDAGGGGVVLRFDVAALREMITSYHATDLWDVLEASGGDVEMVVAEKSQTVSDADRGRLAAAPPHVHVHTIAGAGHWLHIDAPAAVVELFAAHLP
jgi:pimeloyl-ACP methyl ester carboxylesterase